MKRACGVFIRGILVINLVIFSVQELSASARFLAPPSLRDTADGLSWDTPGSRDQARPEQTHAPAGNKKLNNKRKQAWRKVIISIISNPRLMTMTRAGEMSIPFYQSIHHEMSITTTRQAFNDLVEKGYFSCDKRERTYRYKLTFEGEQSIAAEFMSSEDRTTILGEWVQNVFSNLMWRLQGISLATSFGEWWSNSDEEKMEVRSKKEYRTFIRNITAALQNRDYHGFAREARSVLETVDEVEKELIALHPEDDPRAIAGAVGDLGFVGGFVRRVIYGVQLPKAILHQADIDVIIPEKYGDEIKDLLEKKLIAKGLAEVVHVIGTNGVFNDHITNHMSGFTMNRVILFKNGAFKDPFGGLEAMRKRELTLMNVPQNPQHISLLKPLLRGIKFMSQVKGLHFEMKTKRLFHQAIPEILRQAHRTRARLNRINKDDERVNGLSPEERLAPLREEFLVSASIWKEDYLKEMIQHAVHQERLLWLLKRYRLDGLFEMLLGTHPEQLISTEREDEILLLRCAQGVIDVLKGTIGVGNMIDLAGLEGTLNSLQENFPTHRGIERSQRRPASQAAAALEAMIALTKAFRGRVEKHEIIENWPDAESVLMASFTFTNEFMESAEKLERAVQALGNAPAYEDLKRRIMTELEIPIIALHDYSLGDPLVLSRLRSSDERLINIIQEMHQTRKKNGITKARPASPVNGSGVHNTVTSP